MGCATDLRSEALPNPRMQPTTANESWLRPRQPSDGWLRKIRCHRWFAADAQVVRRHHPTSSMNYEKRPLGMVSAG